MKYIDADKLLAETERRKGDAKLYDMSGGDAPIYDELLSIIESLKQDQPEVDLVAELKHHLATTPKDQLEKEWKELEPWGNIGPTVQEFLYGKQPEVDLEKEILDWIGDEGSCKNGKWTWYECNKMLRHFYELGLNARKEE